MTSWRLRNTFRLLSFSFCTSGRQVLMGIVLTSTVGTVTGIATTTAWAQVSTNLDALPEAPKTSHASAPTPSHHAGQAAHHEAVHQTRHQAHAGSGDESHAAPLPPAPRHPGFTTVPALPTAPPKPLVMAPPFVSIPTHPPVPPETVTPNEKANTTFGPLPTQLDTANGNTTKTGSTKADSTQTAPQDGARIVFSPNSAALNEKTLSAVQKLGEELAASPEKRIVLNAYAQLPGDDISMPRRLALQRALVVRSLLMSNGVASTRIYPIAHGRPPSSDTGPGDRVDLVLQTNTTPVITPIPGEPTHDGQAYDPLLSPVNYSHTAPQRSASHAPAPKAATVQGSQQDTDSSKKSLPEKGLLEDGQTLSAHSVPTTQGAFGP